MICLLVLNSIPTSSVCSYAVEPENYISQIALPGWDALAEDQRIFFSSVCGTSSLSNGASAASVAQSSWDLALRTADCSSNTTGAEQKQPSQVTGSSTSQDKYNSIGGTVDSWALAVSVGVWSPGFLDMVILTFTAEAVLQLPQQQRLISSG